MEGALKLAKTYRVTTSLTERLRLADDLFAIIEPEMRFFMFTHTSPDAAPDVLQEALKGIATSLDRFAGNSEGEFWSWCYRIARNKLADQFRKQGTDRMQALPSEELWPLIEASAQTEPLSPADRDQLDYAMRLLAASKPECRDYLWRHFVIGLDYAEIAASEELSYDTARMRVNRCLDEVRSLVA